MKRVVALLGVVVFSSVLGCNRHQGTANNAGIAQPGGAGPAVAAVNYTGEFAEAHKLYDANGCVRCHGQIQSDGGEGAPKGPRKAPDLSKEGAKRDKDYIAEHITNPKAHNPNSRMPPAKNLQPEQVQAIANYLSSLK